jgi:hypothetical protein
MRGSAKKGDLLLLPVLLVLFGLASACEWNSKTDKRYDKWVKTACGTIDRASSEKEKCNTEYDEQAEKEACIEQWDEGIIQPLIKNKAAANDAYLACDDETLDMLKEAGEKLIKSAAEQAGKKIVGLVPLQAQPVCGTNFVDPFDNSPMSVNLNFTRTSQSGNLHTYSVDPGSFFAVSYDDGLTLETYPASGTIQIRVRNTGLSQLTVTVEDLDLLLDMTAAEAFGCLEVTNNLANPHSFKMQGVLIGVGFVGTQCGWWDYKMDYWTDNGSYLTKLKSTLSTNFQTFRLYTQNGVTSASVYPTDTVSVSGDYIYDANFHTDLVIGQSAQIVVEGVEPGAAVTFYASRHLVVPTLYVGGVPWDLDPSGQLTLGSAVADGNGRVDFFLSIPYDPTLIGARYFFQGLAAESGGIRSTMEFSGVIQ